VLDRSTPESFRTFEEAVRGLKFVLDCHLVAGDFDYFLKIRVGGMEDFNRLHGTRGAGVVQLAQAALPAFDKICQWEFLGGHARALVEAAAAPR
jgi:DNA-binding Lrp family transcriptional regulator